MSCKNKGKTMAAVTLSQTIPQIPSRGPISRLTHKLHEKIYNNQQVAAICAIALGTFGTGLFFSSFFLSGYSFYVFISFGSLNFLLSLLLIKEIAVIKKDFLYEAYHGLKSYRNHKIDPSIKITYDPDFEKNIAAKNPKKAFYSKPYKVGKNSIFKGAIFFINGMNNHFKTARSTAEHLSNLGGQVKIHGVHNASHSLDGDVSEDLAECRKNLYQKVATPPVTILRDEIKNYLKNNQDHEALIITHSQGAVQTGLALEILAKSDPALLKKVHLLAIAPGAFLSKQISNNIASYRVYCSHRDPIPMIDSLGRRDQINAIRTLDRHPDIKQRLDPDHSIKSKTYSFVLARKINWFIQKCEGLV